MSTCGAVLVGSHWGRNKSSVKPVPGDDFGKFMVGSFLKIGEILIG